MMRYFLFTVALLAVLRSLEAQGWNGQSGYGYKSEGTRGGRYPMTSYDGAPNAVSSNKSESSKSPSGVTAWGIVAIILAVIAVGCGVHYFLFCYPIVCKNQRKYEVMELTSV